MTGRLNETELHKLYQKQTRPVRQAGEVRRAGLFGLVRGVGSVMAEGNESGSFLGEKSVGVTKARSFNT
jgi:hypothetical protein